MNWSIAPWCPPWHSQKTQTFVVDNKINNYVVTIDLSFDNKQQYARSKRPLLQLIFMVTSSRLFVRNCRYSCYCYIEFIELQNPPKPARINEMKSSDALFNYSIVFGWTFYSLVLLFPPDLYAVFSSSVSSRHISPSFLPIWPKDKSGWSALTFSRCSLEKSMNPVKGFFPEPPLAFCNKRWYSGNSGKWPLKM